VIAYIRFVTQGAGACTSLAGVPWAHWNSVLQLKVELVISLYCSLEKQAMFAVTLRCDIPVVLIKSQNVM